MLARKVYTCAYCELIQFVTERNQCRRCHKGLAPEETPAPLVLVPFEERRDFSYIGANVRAIRLRHKITQSNLALRMCVARSYISKIETSQIIPTVESLDRIAKALLVDIPTLLCEPRESDPFLAEIAPYVSQLDAGTREYILNIARELAAAK